MNTQCLIHATCRNLCHVVTIHFSFMQPDGWLHTTPCVDYIHAFCVILPSAKEGGFWGEFIIYFIFLPNRIGISKTVSLLYKSDTPNINGVSVKKNQGLFWKKKNPTPSSPKGSKRGYIFFHSCSFSFIFFISCFL